MTETVQKEELDISDEELSSLVKIIRAFQGIPPDSETAINKLINMKNILERSRFPTYPIIARQVYLRLIEKYYPEYAEACLSWANYEAEALIEYKGQGRTEFVDMNKAPQPPQGGQEFYLGAKEKAPIEAKKHWWSRGKKQEEELKE